MSRELSREKKGRKKQLQNVNWIVLLLRFQRRCSFLFLFPELADEPFEVIVNNQQRDAQKNSPQMREGRKMIIIKTIEQTEVFENWEKEQEQNKTGSRRSCRQQNDANIGQSSTFPFHWSRRGIISKRKDIY